MIKKWTAEIQYSGLLQPFTRAGDCITALYNVRSLVVPQLQVPQELYCKRMGKGILGYGLSG